MLQHRMLQGAFDSSCDFLVLGVQAPLRYVPLRILVYPMIGCRKDFCSLGLCGSLLSCQNLQDDQL